MAIAAGEMCIGGARGAEITIPTEIREDVALFSESNGKTCISWIDGSGRRDM